MTKPSRFFIFCQSSVASARCGFFSQTGFCLHAASSHMKPPLWAAFLHQRSVAWGHLAAEIFLLFNWHRCQPCLEGCQRLDIVMQRRVSVNVAQSEVSIGGLFRPNRVAQLQ